MIDEVTILKGAGGSAFALIVGRMMMSWWRKQNAGDVVSDKTQELITRLEKEVQKKDTELAEMKKLYEELHENNTLLRINNAMMRQMLISRGVTEAELIAIGAVRHE